MRYDVKERSSIDDKEYDLMNLVEKLKAIDLQLSSIPSLSIELREIFNEDDVQIDFHSPIKSKLLIYTYFNEKVITYDYKSFEVTGIRINPNRSLLDSILMSKTNNKLTGYHLYFSELIAFLFYTGAYERIRRGEYNGSTKLADLIMDIGELVYDNPNVLQLYNNQLLGKENVPFHYSVVYIIRWEPESWLKGYIGIMINSSGTEYSFLILDETKTPIFEVELSRYRGGYRRLSGLSLDTAKNLPLVKAMIDSFNKIRNDIEKYIDALKLAYISTNTYIMLAGV
ncbi:MAG: hypothetical protein QXE70_04350 [Ignisphaera sp.]